MLKPVLSESPTGSLRVWDDPRSGVEYVIGADAAEGRKRDRTAAMRRGIGSYSDQRPDYSAAIVLEMESGLHVASWHGYIPPDEFATVLAGIGWHYNTALLVPELNGPGLAVVTRLTETLQYDNIYRSHTFNVMDMDPLQPKWGFRTDATTRKILMLRVYESLNSNRLFTRDRALIDELRTMEFDDQGSERGRGNNKDDRVFALALALQGRHTSMGSPTKPPPRAAGRAFDDAVWDKVLAQQEASRARSDGRGSVGRGLYPGGSRGPWIGRGGS